LEMRIKNKLAFLELVAGIFGWGWLIASGFAVYYLVMAVGFGGSWAPFFVALGAGAVSKWLAKGFEDNKRRVAFEVNIIAKGASHAEAGRAWLEAYNGQGRTPATVEKPSASGRIEENKAKPEERARIIADYGRLIERDPMAGEIRDVRFLPHDKKAILGAICLEIVRAEDERQLEALKVGALCLADYQEGVGDQPLSRLGIDPSSVDASSMNVEELRVLADKIAGNPDSERFGTFKRLVKEDLIEIRAKLLAAEQLRRDMPESKKNQILG
jgi:hypothetical protein